MASADARQFRHHGARLAHGLIVATGGVVEHLVGMVRPGHGARPPASLDSPRATQAETRRGDDLDATGVDFVAFEQQFEPRALAAADVEPTRPVRDDIGDLQVVLAVGCRAGWLSPAHPVHRPHASAAALAAAAW